MFGASVDAGEKEEAVEERRHLLRLGANEAYGFTIFARGTIEAQSELGFRADESNGSA
jgi:hypothetical protein